MIKQAQIEPFAAIDIGTSKVVALLAEPTESGDLHIVGVGSHPSRGLKRGVVVNIESTVEAIQRAVEEAELMAGSQIRSAYVGIAGSHISSLNSHGIVAVRDHEVTQADITRVIDAAKAVAIPADRQMLHVLPQEFVLDAQEGIKEPLGMSGVRLEAKVHMVVGAVSAAQNIVKCVERCGLAVTDVVLEQLASSYAVLTEDEKELGVCLIDIGGGTTDIAIFTGGSIRHTAVIPIAGDQVTNDIAIALCTPTQYAEAIKMNHATVLTDSSRANTLIEIPSVGDRAQRKIPSKNLADVVGARYEELFALVQAEIRRSGFENLLAAGIVLTGGASSVGGAVELAERVFQLPIRSGVPQRVTGMEEAVSSPIYATGIGLLLHAQQQQQHGYVAPAQMGDGFKGVWGRMRRWFQGNF